MKLGYFGYKAAHEWVTSNSNAQWDGWTVEVHTPRPGAMFKKNGAYRDGKWGILNRYPIQDNGRWRLPA